MNRPPPSDIEGKEQGDSLIRARLKRLMAKTIPRLTGTSDEKAKPGTLEFGLYHAEEMYKLLSTLRDSSQVFEWPVENEGRHRTFEAGRKMYLVFIDDEGKPKLSDEMVNLPRRPLVLLDALEAYISGTSWPEIQEMLSNDPDIKDEEISRTIEENISKIKTLRNARDVLGTIGPGITNKNVRDRLLRLLTQRIEKNVDEEVARSGDFKALRALQADVLAFFNHPQTAVLSRTGIIDILDIGGSELGKRLLDSADTLEKVEAVEQSIEDYVFSFRELYEKNLNERVDDVKARIGFLKRLRNARSEKGLNALKAQIESHEFKSEQADSYKKQLYMLIEAKRSKYKPRWDDKMAQQRHKN
jgi:hypothetical protein